MKQKFVIISMGLSLFVLVVYLLCHNLGNLDRLLSIVICLAVSVPASMICFNWIIKPVNDMQKQLEIMTEESRKADNIRKEFVANVTHELKTPLTSISGFIETLQDGAAEDPEIRTKFIDIIAIEAARLKRLIEDILILSDIESKREQAVAIIDVRRALLDTLAAITPVADNKKIKLCTQIDEGCYISGSEDRFRQMMVNLIENAIKYSNDDKTVMVTAENKGKKVIVSVKDQGIGIAPEHIDRLFERFYRVDKSRSAKEGGSGLGLSIVKHIAFLFGAELKVNSELGKGSEFIVTFNREEAYERN